MFLQVIDAKFIKVAFFIGLKDINSPATQVLCSGTKITQCWHIFKAVENVTVAKLELAHARCQSNLKTVRNLTVRKSLQDFDAKEVYLNPKNRPVSFQKRREMFCFHHFRVFTRCLFQNVPARVPFAKSTAYQNLAAKVCRFPSHHRTTLRFRFASLRRRYALQFTCGPK